MSTFDETFKQLCRGSRPTQVVSLRKIAAQRKQPTTRHLVLQAFGDDVQTEVVRQVDDRADDNRMVVVRQQVADERTVDLQLIHRQLLQVAERGITCAEVV